MSGSYIFLLHLIGFALVSAMVITGTILNRKLIKEADLGLKLYIGGIMRSLSAISPFVALLILVTGIGNIYNHYLGAPIEWYQEGWLVVKIILFGVMLVNGTVFGPMMAKKRMQLVESMQAGSGSDDMNQQLAQINKQMSWFFVVQNVLLLGILFFSAFGTSKHPGVF